MGDMLSLEAGNIWNTVRWTEGNSFRIQDTLLVPRLECVGKSSWIESLDMK